VPLTTFPSGLQIVTWPALGPPTVPAQEPIRQGPAASLEFDEARGSKANPSLSRAVKGRSEACGRPPLSASRLSGDPVGWKTRFELWGRIDMEGMDGVGQDAGRERMG
jgi:hypothetical protein